MAENLTTILNTISGANYNWTDLSTSDILTNAINTTNTSTNGWAGILILTMLCFAVTFHIYKNLDKWQIVERLNIVLVSMCVYIDIAIYLLYFGILSQLQIFIQLYVVFVMIATFSMLKKDMMSGETG